MAIDSLMWTVHVLFAGLWTGSVLFVAAAILPPALAGDIAPELLGQIADRLRTFTRVSALLLFLSGGHLAGTLYTVETLTGTGRGHLVLTMLVLWFLLVGLVEVGVSKLSSGLEKGKLREPVRDAKWFVYGAAVVALLLLVDAGLLAGNAV